MFDDQNLRNYIDRINLLSPTTQPEWGKMNVAQMLAHNNVAFDINYGVIPVSYNPISRFMVKLFAKSTVVGDKPYGKNGRTAPVFIISDERDFELEKTRLIAYLHRIQAEGAPGYEGRVSPAFGELSSEEWSTMFSKHLDHHLTQFGV
jgi:hypothetical protein